MLQKNSLVLACLVTCFVNHASGQTKTASLPDYVGLDVSKLTEEQRQQFLSVFRETVGDPDALKSDPYEFKLDRLYEFPEPTSLRCFIETAPGWTQPTFSGMRVHYFDPEWKRVSVDAFSTGYRQPIESISQQSGPMKDQTEQYLVLKTGSAGPWEVSADGKKERPLGFVGAFQLQYYGVVGNQLMLVRMEDDQRRAVLNNYRDRAAPAIGMRYPKANTSQLLEMLQAGTTNERLALLVWLTGVNSPSHHRDHDGVPPEVRKTSESRESLRRSPQFPKILEEIRKSDHPWIRDYAANVFPLR